MNFGKLLLPVIGSRSLGVLSKSSIRFGFSSSPVSWKKIKDKIFQREKYFPNYEMQSSSLRIEHQKYKIYITPRSPEIIRTGINQYRILEDEYNFTITFLDNLDYMGKEFTWNNRKNIGLTFKDILRMEKASPSNPLTFVKVHNSTYNNQTTKTIKQLKIQVSELDYSVKISFQITSEKDGDKWLGVYQLTNNHFQFLVQSAKKNIYYSSGLKTMIELQKREIIRQMEKRVPKNQQKPLKSSISYQTDADKSDLLSEMEKYQDSLN